MAKKKSNMVPQKQIWGRELEYIMPRMMYDDLVSEAPKNVNTRDWVMQYINDTYGLLGTVTVLHIEGENIAKKTRQEINEELAAMAF